MEQLKMDGALELIRTEYMQYIFLVWKTVRYESILKVCVGRSS